MYNFSTTRDQQQATLFTLSSKKSLVTTKALRLQPIGLIQAQSKLLLDINIHQNHEESKWPALQYFLKEHFQDIIASQLIPGCVLKIHVYILNQEEYIESALANAVWICLLLHGVPMKSSVFHYQWKSQQRRNYCVLDLNKPSSIIFAKHSQPIIDQAYQQCKQYKNQLTSFLSQNWSR